MGEDGDRTGERWLGNDRRVRAMALAGAAVATAVIRRRMLSRMRRVVHGAGHPGMIHFHPVVRTGLTALVANLGRGRRDGSERDRPGHAERKLQQQHGADSPSNRSRSHGMSLHR